MRSAEDGIMGQHPCAPPPLHFALAHGFERVALAPPSFNASHEEMVSE